MDKELVIATKQLPDSIKELQKFILVAKETLKVYKARLNVVKGLDLAVKVRTQTLEDGQRVGEALLYAKAKMGELLKSSSKGTFKKGGEKSLPKGITKKQSHFAQKLYEHKDLIEEVVKEAKQNEDIPTRTEVFRIAKETEKERDIKEAVDMKKETENPKYKPLIKQISFIDFLHSIEDESVDLLLTDPPYSTEIKDIYKFAKWIKLALPKIKPIGRAYICIGAYPKELEAYLNILNNQNEMILSNILVWTYRNTLGPSSKMGYNQNWQAILYLYGRKAEKLNCPLLNEQFAVQDINAPDNRTGIRYHRFEKPVELAKRFICHSTKEDDLVLDCFAGTGTFILTATSLNRRAIGCEISDDMLKIAKKENA